MELFFNIIFFVFGLCMGSFLNCVVYWLEKEKRNNLCGRSFCPNCLHVLNSFELIPILSFVFSKGKCRHCNKKISWQYPAVEILTGIVFLLIFNYQFSLNFKGITMSEADYIFNQFTVFNFQIIANLVYLLLISSFLIIVFVFDWKHCLVPAKAIYPAIIISIAWRIVEILKVFKNDVSPALMAEKVGFLKNFLIFVKLLNPFIAAFAAAGFFFLIWLISRGKWMGFGDVEIAFLMGLFLGIPTTIVALFFAFLIGAIIGLILICLKKKGLKSEIPFGPFLVISTFISLFWSKEIIIWFLKLSNAN